MTFVKIARIVNSWKLFLILQGVGTVLLAAGAERSITAYTSGFVLLLPGSAVMGFFPYPIHWINAHLPTLVSSTDVDAYDVVNTIFLPSALLFNALFVLLIRKAIAAYQRRCLTGTSIVQVS